MVRPKIGLALGAGGAKGLAHIGVLQVLEEAGIPIDFIAGSSMGAVIGAFYAAGTELEMMAKLATELNNNHLIDIAIPRWGLIKGRKAHALIRLMTHNKNFDQLKIPLQVVATDLEKGEKVVFKDGNVASAVRASIAVPGVVQPLCLNDKILVDGAVTDRVPAEIVKKMGADIVIAVDLQYYPKEKVNIENIYDVILQSIEILERQVRDKYKKYADIIVKPRVSTYTWTNFEVAADFIELGREACTEVLDEIRERIGTD